MTRSYKDSPVKIVGQQMYSADGELIDGVKVVAYDVGECNHYRVILNGLVTVRFDNFWDVCDFCHMIYKSRGIVPRGCEDLF